MFTQLKTISERPAPFSVYTADVLWTDPHLSGQMLATHLSQDTDLASRRAELINDGVAWLDRRLSLQGKRVLDLGCGPGLYARRFDALGAVVTGLDFSANSIAYAKAQGGNVTYIVGDYLKDPLPEDQDVVTLIYCDLCALSSERRQTLYAKVREVLAPGGRLVFDVVSHASFAKRSELSTHGLNYMNGFWAGGEYFALHDAFVYPDVFVTLDKFTIVEPHKTWQVFNWMQYFSKDTIRAELTDNGFRVLEVGHDFTNADLCIVAEAA